MRVDAPQEVRGADDILFLCRGFRARTNLTIDLRGVRWISPLGVVAVLSTALAAQHRAIRVTVDAPSNQTARTYLDRIGFWDELSRQGWEADGDMDFDDGYQVQACMPVSPLSSEREVEEATNKLSEDLKSALAPGMHERVWTVAIELTQNAREHGSPCYMVVQTHTGRSSGTPGIHVAVSDFGPGFAESLRPVTGKLEDDAAIIRAFEERVSGTGLPERGFGLGYILDEIDRHPGAMLVIVSRTATVTRTAGKFHVVPDKLDFRGTLASAYFPYRPPEATE